MDLKENKTLAAIVGVMVVGGIGLAVVLFMTYSGYSASLEQYNTASNGLAALQGAKLFPSKEHVEERETAVAEYEAAVGRLGGVLLKLQEPVKPLTATEFQPRLKAAISETRQMADSVKAKLPKEFAFGFDKYTTSLPKNDEVAAQLADYLAAAGAVTNLMIQSGVESIDSFDRSSLVIEGDAPAPKPTPAKVTKKPAKGPKGKNAAATSKAPPVKEVAQALERRTVTVTLTTDQGALQNLMNGLASPSKMVHFTVVRQLRIDNQKQEGPVRGSLGKVELDNAGGTVPGFPKVDETGATAATAPAPAATAPAGTAPKDKSKVIEPVKPGAKDSQPVFGEEKLLVYLEIDLVRFLEPAPSEAAAK